MASRTDRGVSARANAVVIDSALSGSALLRRLNAVSTEIVFTAARPVPAEFNPRRAVGRSYRYYEFGAEPSLAHWAAAARLFRGPVDARSFGRGLPADRPSWRTIDRVEVRCRAGGLEIEVRAPFFAWGMVRKIVGSLREHAAGRLSLRELSEGIGGRRRLTVPMAEPEGLVLWEVEYSEAWTVLWEGPSRAQRRRAAARTAQRWREELLPSFESGADFPAGTDGRAPSAGRSAHDPP